MERLIFWIEDLGYIRVPYDGKHPLISVFFTCLACIGSAYTVAVIAGSFLP